VLEKLQQVKTGIPDEVAAEVAAEKALKRAHEALKTDVMMQVGLGMSMMLMVQITKTMQVDWQPMTRAEPLQKMMQASREKSAKRAMTMMKKSREWRQEGMLAKPENSACRDRVQRRAF
jgi:hypothetical protein